MIRMHGNQYCLSERIRQGVSEVPPLDWQHVVCLIKNHPMWTPSTNSQGPKAREELAEERGSICELNA